MHPKNLLAAAALSLSLGLASNAAQASVTYDFTALTAYPVNGETVTGSFSVTLPDFITSATQVPVADLSSCSVVDSGGPASCLAEDFLYDVAAGYETIGFHFSSAANPGTETYYYFNAGSLEAPGTYASQLLGDAQEGTLTVTQSTSAIPEPAALPLMAAGLGLLVAALRRKQKSSQG